MCYITCGRSLLLYILFTIKYQNHCGLLFYTNMLYIYKFGRDSNWRPNINIIGSNTDKNDLIFGFQISYPIILFPDRVRPHTDIEILCQHYLCIFFKNNYIGIYGRKIRYVLLNIERTGRRVPIGYVCLGGFFFYLYFCYIL